MEALANNVMDCALVLEGGGYRESYTSGLVTVLLEQGIYFDYVCGLSAGSSTTVNYVSRDIKRMHDSFVVDDKTKNFVGIRSVLRRRPFFDADALYEGGITNNILPFDWETFEANPARVRIQTFEADTGRTIRFGREDMTDLMTMVKQVRASSTLPGMMEPLTKDGHTYYDGGLGTGAGIPLWLAEEDGFDRFFFIATRPRGYRKEEPSKRERNLYLKLAEDYPYLRNALLTRSERYNTEIERVEKMVEEGRCFIVYPDEMNVSSSTTNPQKLQASYDAGYAQGMRDLPKWREFLFGSPDAGPQSDVDHSGYITIG